MATITKRMERQVEIRSGRLKMTGVLRTPPGAKGIVVLAQATGSGRFSPRNQFVDRALGEAGLATLLVDLLGEEEGEENAVDVELLAYRLQSIADWLGDEPETHHLRLGYFAAGTRAGAALVAAARYPAPVRAVVCRGGRPDLASDDLAAVRAPTLLIVGRNDDAAMELNEQALHLLRCPKELVTVPGATHLFEEPGALEEVARLAGQWFGRYLAGVSGKSHRPQGELGSRFPQADMDTEC